MEKEDRRAKRFAELISKTRWKRVCMSCGAVLLLLLIADLIVSALIDTERIEKEIISQIESTLHRDGQIGAASIGLFSGLRLESDRLAAHRYAVTIKDRDGFGPDPFLTVRSIAVKVRLMPLLKGQIVPKQVILKDPVIVIKQNVSGELNVSDIFHEEASEQTQDASATRLDLLIKNSEQSQASDKARASQKIGDEKVGEQKSSEATEISHFRTFPLSHFLHPRIPLHTNARSGDSGGLLPGWKINLQDTQFILKGATVKLIREKRRSKDPSKIKRRIQTIEGIDIKLIPDIGGLSPAGKGAVKIALLEAKHKAFAFRASGQVATKPVSAVVEIDSGRFSLFDIQPRPRWLKRFRKGELRLENLTAQLTAETNPAAQGDSTNPRALEVTLNDLSCKLNGGAVKANGKIALGGDAPQFKIRVECEDADLDPFLWRTRDDLTSFGGLMSFTLDFEGADPFNPKAWRKDITGGRKIHIRNGRFEHKVLLEILQLVEARVLSEALGISSLEENQVYEATCRFTFTEGRFYGKLHLNSKDIALRFKDSSWIGLDGKLRCVVTIAIKGEDICDIRVKGSLDDPRVSLKSMNEATVEKILNAL